MRYIAEQKDGKYLITGIKFMETVDGYNVEVKVDTKEYDKAKLEETLASYTKERDAMFEQYNDGIKDLEAMLEAIEYSK